LGKFNFRLESLLKLRKYERDVRQQRLVEKLAEDQQLLDQRNRLEQAREQVLEELRQLQQARVVKVEQAAARRYYAGRLLAVILEVERQRQLLKQEIERRRRELAEAEKKVKVLEKLKEKQRAEHQYEALRAEALALEDTWAAAQQRRPLA